MVNYEKEVEDERPLEDRRRRIRKNSDGTLNQADIDHNNRMYKKYFLCDNLWMIDVICAGKATLQDFKAAGILEQ